MASNSVFAPLQRVLTCLALQVTEGASLAAGGFEIEYDGSHVGQPLRPRTTLPSQSVLFLGKPFLDLSQLSLPCASAALTEQQVTKEDSQQAQSSRRSILAKVPERYCHVGLHTAGKPYHSVTVLHICSVYCSTSSPHRLNATISSLPVALQGKSACW